MYGWEPLTKAPSPTSTAQTLAPGGQQHLHPGHPGFIVVQWEEVAMGQPSLFWSLLQQDALDTRQTPDTMEVLQPRAAPC